MNKKFIVYLDILGFEELAENIEKNENIRSEIVRKELFINPLMKKIQKLKTESKIIGGKSIADNWILIIDGYENLYETISKILETEINIVKYVTNPKENYGTIQFEIVIGSYEFDKWAGLDGDEIICDDNTIRYLKSHLINKYKNFHKETNSERITESFTIATDSFFDDLSFGMKKYLVNLELEYLDKSDNILKKYYLLHTENVIKEGKISEFLNSIGQTNSDFSGALIDRLFIPPDEFDEIKGKLKKDRIIFISGTAGYGKTYTTIRLLWEWYNKGYTPKWIAGKEEKQRENVRDKLANIDAELKPRHIIYFEDPFGRTTYERRDDLKEKINNIINSIENKTDVYSIITSRKDVFEQFEKESYSVEEIRRFEQQLNIIKPSYDYHKRINILEKWADEKECEWIKDEKLKKFVNYSLTDKKILPTPLNIHDFVIATRKTKNRRELEQYLDKYSKEGEKAFADEIKGLYHSGRKDRVLFLSFIFVSENFMFNFINEQYEDMKLEHYEDLRKILFEEHRVKRELPRQIMGEWMGGLTFSHPSYSKALPYVLEDSGCQRIFCDVLKKLVNRKPGYTLKALSENFDILPKNTTNELILKLAKRDEIAKGLIKVIMANFNVLSPNVQNILFNFANIDKNAKYLSRGLVEKFNELPENVRNKLLLKLADKKESIKDLANVIVTNFDLLPNDIQNLLFKFANNKVEANYIVWAIVMNFNNLPSKIQNILFELADREYAAGYVLWAVAIEFYDLPENAQNLLYKTSIQR